MYIFFKNSLLTPNINDFPYLRTFSAHFFLAWKVEKVVFFKLVRDGDDIDNGDGMMTERVELSENQGLVLP